MNSNDKVTIQKKENYVPSTDDTKVQSPKAEPTSYIKFVHFISFNTYVLFRFILNFNLG